MKMIPLFSHPFFVAYSLQLLLAYEWITGGWEKIHGSIFVSTIEKTLLRFENGNPHAWYTSSILTYAKNHLSLFGGLVPWGELFVGLGLILVFLLSVFYPSLSQKKGVRLLAICALMGGIFMNLNFYFAAGWTSPSTSGLNLFMLFTQIILILFWMPHLPTTRRTKTP